MIGQLIERGAAPSGSRDRGEPAARGCLLAQAMGPEATVGAGFGRGFEFHESAPSMQAGAQVGLSAARLPTRRVRAMLFCISFRVNKDTGRVWAVSPSPPAPPQMRPHRRRGSWYYVCSGAGANARSEPDGPRMR